MTEQKPKTKHIQAHIDEKLFLRLKVFCIETDTTIRSVIVSLITELLSKEDLKHHTTSKNAQTLN